MQWKSVAVSPEDLHPNNAPQSVSHTYPELIGAKEVLICVHELQAFVILKNDVDECKTYITYIPYDGYYALEAFFIINKKSGGVTYNIGRIGTRRSFHDSYVDGIFYR